MARVRVAAVQASDLNGVSGHVSFDQYGDTTTKTLTMYKVVDGDFAIQSNDPANPLVSTLTVVSDQFGVAQVIRLFCESDKDGLCDFLGLMRVSDVPQRDGINQIDVPRYQLGKGFVGMIFRILPQQHAVIRLLHSRISVR